jgi:glycosyltransferase involved in cell wall biosynthesis
VESKGIRTLLAAHERLGQRGRDIRLLIAGSRRPNLKVLGFVEDIAGLWARAHIAVLPSYREGLPLSLLEAAACGRPLVATDVPGCREIARPGVNAFLVPLDDIEALANAIDRLARDPQLRREFGKAGREPVEPKFSSERIGRDVVALYRRLLGQTD